MLSREFQGRQAAASVRTLVLGQNRPARLSVIQLTCFKFRSWGAELTANNIRVPLSKVCKKLPKSGLDAPPLRVYGEATFIIYLVRRGADLERHLRRIQRAVDKGSEVPC